MADMGTSWYSAPSTPIVPLGIRAPRPLPNPLRRMPAYLLGQLPVGDGPPGGWVEHDDRLPERRRLTQSNRARHDVAADRWAKVRAHLLGHLLRKLGAGVIHRQDDRRELEGGIEVGLHELDVLQQLAQTLKCVVLALDGHP